MIKHYNQLDKKMVLALDFSDILGVQENGCIWMYTVYCRPISLLASPSCRCTRNQFGTPLFFQQKQSLGTPSPSVLQLLAVFFFSPLISLGSLRAQGTVLRQVVPVPTVARFRTLCGLQFSYLEYLVTCENAYKQIL